MAGEGYGGRVIWRERDIAGKDGYGGRGYMGLVDAWSSFRTVSSSYNAVNGT